MGCFSYMCKESDKPILSTSFDGSPCRLYLLKDGKIVEEMYGNYDSYGRVFDGKGGNFQWEMDWGEVCSLHFSSDCRSGIAAILDEHFDGQLPTSCSDNDPNQGWGDGIGLIGDCSDDMFVPVEQPYHNTYYESPFDPLETLDKDVANWYTAINDTKNEIFEKREKIRRLESELEHDELFIKIFQTKLKDLKG